MNPAGRYEQLVRSVRDEVLLGSIAATLEWDEETCMPEAGGANRGRQQGLLAGLVHQRATDPRRGEWLAELEAAELPPDAAINVRELRTAYERDRRLPQALVEDLAEAVAVAPLAWADARRRRDFSRFAPELERVLALKRAEAACLAADRGAQPAGLYDALLDDHEEGLSWAELSPMFVALERGLGELVDRARGAARPPAPGAFAGTFAIDAQRKLGEWVAGAIGFDLGAGRLDPAVHPFAIGLGPGDTRIAGRWDEHDLSSGLLTVLHEAGHGLYEQGLDHQQWGLPCGTQVSDAVDESQARLYQHVVGKSAGFWTFLWPTLTRFFPELAARDRDRCVRSLTRIEPGCERGVADEVTYHLHIIIRVELERALLVGDLAVADLPAAWDEQYRARLGVTPRDVGEGCLQDGHWAEGLFGYFPCYTLGDLYATALIAGAERELGPLEPMWAAGELAPLREWLRRRVHQPGSRRPARELITAAAGEAPSTEHLLARLRARLAWAYADG